MTSSETEWPEPQAWLLKQASRGDVLATELATWGDTGLEIRWYLGVAPPPLNLVTSVRTVLFHDRMVMVLQDGDQRFHVFPGGRREPGETVEATLRREVLEETGWTVASFQPLGFAVFRHLTPRPADYPYPYPHFVHLLFIAEAAEQVAEAQLGEYEVSSVFYPVHEAFALPLTQEQATLLDAALRVRDRFE